jgi:hypothetical protein
MDFGNLSFVRFRELSITGNVPLAWVRRLRVRDLGITVAARNLGLWTKYSGIDPEVSNAGGGNNFSGQFNNRNTLNNDARADLGGATPLSRSWIIRINTGL